VLLAVAKLLSLEFDLQCHIHIQVQQELQQIKKPTNDQMIIVTV
jgi:hypothetical protein